MLHFREEGPTAAGRGRREGVTRRDFEEALSEAFPAQRLLLGEQKKHA